MKKDISFPKITNVQIAIAREANPEGEGFDWGVYLLNRNNHALTNVLVTSSGYGEGGQQTSTLRHFFAEVLPQSYVKIERIDPSVFGLTNEFWVSFWIDSELYDKRYIFAPESVTDLNIGTIHFMAMDGVLHD